MALTYSVMAPAIMVAALLYFCLMYLSTRYNLIYAFKDHREGGGTHWPLNGKCTRVHMSFSNSDLSLLLPVHLIFSGMLLFQLTMIGVFLVFDFYGGEWAHNLFFFGIIFQLTHHQERNTCCRLCCRRRCRC